MVRHKKKIAIKMKNPKITVLILTPYFLPGYKAGGPIQSLRNLISHLSNRINFKIITPDHDLGEKKAYSGITSDRWNRVYGVDVFYLSDKNMTLPKIGHLIKNTNHDVRYYNSFFYPYLTIYPLLLEKMRRIPRMPSILAPRGEMAPRALQLNKSKKKIFLGVARLLNLYSNLNWQVSSKHEKEQLRKILSVNSNRIEIIPNLPPKLDFDVKPRKSSKESGKVRLVFISRIAPIKNLSGALTLLKKVRGQVTFDIYGPKEDRTYFDLCMRLKKELPNNILINYHGPVSHDQVATVLQQYDFLFFPSKDENFGHIILEAFLSGTPVIISDRTPWLELDKYQAGWAIELEDRQRFAEVLNYCVKMNTSEHQKLCEGAMNVALNYLNDGRIVEKTFEMFARLAR
ncbi:Glycosyltransferase involved in cell wall bisynthesis [Caldithrix abyssi DSM 13497]|uniref:Glycosyltransferase involved in cell wall bisynthesis n=2 Tax=Caldithrix abyssi DSM 13497 TaxID=880073 RepID=A0A1J1CDY2_CALAY|nr:Glycosyltransferase involved in cell wall bisynthesis [Caldithrix abyssi DSM 13497]